MVVMNKRIPIQNILHWQTLVLAMILVLSARATPSVVGCSGRDGDRLTGVKCVVDGGRPCRAAFSLPYLEGRIYFHRPDAIGVFQHQALDSQNQPRTDSWLICRANHQLLATGQYHQFRCPLTGKPIDANLTLRVAGIDVGFHDPAGYHRVLETPSMAERARLLFAPAPFARGFQSDDRAAARDSMPADGLRNVP